MTTHLGPRVTDRPDKAQSAANNARYVRLLLVSQDAAVAIERQASERVVACLLATMPKQWVA
jgi:hypothetical protein